MLGRGSGVAERRSRGGAAAAAQPRRRRAAARRSCGAKVARFGDGGCGVEMGLLGGSAWDV